MRSRQPNCVAAILFVVTVTAPSVTAEVTLCESQTFCRVGSQTTTHCMSSKFWFEAEAASGARDDVVPVTIALHYAPDLDFEFNSIVLVVCHDPSLVELVGDAVYSEEILARDPLSFGFDPVLEDQDPSHTGYGFYAHFGPLVDRNPVVGRLPLMTVYYRLIGRPGETTEIAFCDGDYLAWGPVRCPFSGIDDTQILPPAWAWPLVSTQNHNGVLTIVDGPATHPDRPPEPPEAVVYSELPTSDEVNLRMRIANAVAVPGERNVPVEVFVTADVEYTGVIVPIDFDERYLRVARVEDYFLAGTAVIDNENAVPGAQPSEGYVVIASSLVGKRRIAPAREEFHAATIYFDVLESAAEISRTVLEPRPVGGRAGDPFVIVRYLSGDAAQKVEARGEIGPGEVENGIIEIRSSLETIGGDANFDGEFNISDPISVLGYLFLGRSVPLCPPAADYDHDGRLDISDPVRMLSVMFSGQTPPVLGDNGLIGCR